MDGTPTPTDAPVTVEQISMPEAEGVVDGDSIETDEITTLTYIVEGKGVYGVCEGDCNRDQDVSAYSIFLKHVPFQVNLHALTSTPSLITSEVC